MKINPSHKIIADHLRCCAFLIADGVLPSNEGRGYVLRRIMRRAMLHIHKLNLSKNNKSLAMYKLVPTLAKEMGAAYPELIRAQEMIIQTLKIEEEKFGATLDRGLEILYEELTKIIKGQKLSGKIAFKLYDTFGFPLDLTIDLLKEKQIEVDLAEFEREMSTQKQRAREYWVGSGGQKEGDLYFRLKEKFGATRFLGYEQLRVKARILAILQDDEEVKNISDLKNKENNKIEIILDQTPFYATGGGQNGDDGNIILASDSKNEPLLLYQQIKNIIDIKEVRNYGNGLFVHLVSDLRGQFKIGDEIVAIVNNRNRQFRAQNHSATHLLHLVLKKILGPSIAQKGSNIESEYFTFDFNFHRALTVEEIDQIEDLVNFYIRQNTEVKTEILELEEARSKGAIALFGEKYDEMVRVLFMGEGQNKEILSIELCGGTHVNSTGNIGIFKIISERGIAAGVRRIEAKTGFFALQYLRLQDKKLQALLDGLKITQQFDEIKLPSMAFHSAKKGFSDLSYFADEINEIKITDEGEMMAIKEVILKAKQLGEEKLAEIKRLNKEIERLKKEKLLADLNKLTVEKFGEINFIHYIFDDLSAKELRDFIIEIKNKSEYKNNSILVFFSIYNNSVAVAIAISDDLTNKFDAGQLIGLVVKEIGGKGGGGKKDLAFAGGANKNGIRAAIQTLKMNIRNGH